MLMMKLNVVFVGFFSPLLLSSIERWEWGWERVLMNLFQYRFVSVTAAINRETDRELIVQFSSVIIALFVLLIVFLPFYFSSNNICNQRHQ